MLNDFNQFKSKLISDGVLYSSPLIRELTLSFLTCGEYEELFPLLLTEGYTPEDVLVLYNQIIYLNDDDKKRHFSLQDSSSYEENIAQFKELPIQYLKFYQRRCSVC